MKRLCLLPLLVLLCPALHAAYVGGGGMGGGVATSAFTNYVGTNLLRRTAGGPVADPWSLISLGSGRIVFDGWPYIMDTTGNVFEFRTNKVNSAVVRRGDATNIVRAIVPDRITSLASQVSTNPSSVSIRLTDDQNALRIWTGNRPVDEPWLDVWMRTNGANTAMLRLYRWQGRIVTLPAGCTVNLGTTNGAVLDVTPMTVNSNLAAYSVAVTNWVNCDRAGPPLWTPTTEHMLFPSNACAFQVLSNQPETELFVSEYDGVRWSAPRWYIIRTNAATTILCTFQRVALANFAGLPLRVAAPEGTVIGGNSSPMTLVPSQPPKFLCSTVADLMQAISNAVCGDVIGLKDGTYAVSGSISNGFFTANALRGFQGMSGITIRGMSGNPAGVVLTGADTNSGMWWFVPSSPSAGDPPARFKGLTFVFTNRTVGNLYWTGGPLIMEDVVVDACSAADEIVHTDCVGDVTFLRCTFAGRNWTNGMNSQAFVGVWGAASNNATLRLVDCTAFGSGTNTSAYIVGGHAGGTPPEVYGGTYFDSSSRLIMSGGLGGAYSFFTKFPNTGPPFIRTNTAYTSMFGCRAETRGAGWFTIYPSLGVRSNAYLLFSSLSATNYPASSTMVGRIAVNEDTNDCPVAHNRITLDGGRFLTLSTGNKTYVGNIVRGAGEGARVYNYTSGNGMPSRLLGNTWVTNTLAVSYGFTNFALAMTNNAFVGNTTAFTMYDYIATNTLRAGYNIIDNTIDAGAYQWPASNTTNVNAAVSIITSIPTAAGNCDDTGLGYGWAADSDPWGLVWLFHPARAPIGAVSVQRTYADAVVFPDAW